MDPMEHSRNIQLKKIQEFRKRMNQTFDKITTLLALLKKIMNKASLKKYYELT